MQKMVLARVWPISRLETVTQVKKLLSQFSNPTKLNEVAILPTIASYRDPMLGECAHPWLAEAVADHFRLAAHVADMSLLGYEHKTMNMRLAFKTTGYENMANEKGMRIVTDEKDMRAADMGVLLLKPNSSVHIPNEVELGFLKRNSTNIVIADFLISPSKFPKLSGAVVATDDIVLMKGLLAHVYQDKRSFVVNDYLSTLQGPTDWIRRHYVQKRPPNITSGPFRRLLGLYARVCGDVVPPVLQGW